MPASAQPYAARRTADIVQLEDTKAQTSVSVITSIGNIVYEMKVKGTNILRFPFASVDDFKARPSRQCCIPFLAPWANRLDEQAFFANGKRYPFDMTLGNVTGAIPIHGLVYLADQWQVTEVKADGKAAWVTSRLDVYKNPMSMKQFPFAHAIEMTYRLQDGALEVRLTVTNMSGEPMPMSMGFHPWFTLTDSPRDEWTLITPAKTRWLLTDQKVPTGMTESTDGFFVNGQGVLKDYDLDDLFSDLPRDANGRATVTLKGRTQRIDVVYGPKYPASVVYSPNPARTGRGSASAAGPRAGGAPGASASAPPGGAAPAAGRLGGAGRGGPGANPLATPNYIAIEPMAGISNAMNLAQKGIYKDLQSIPAGGTWTESFWVRPSGF